VAVVSKLLGGASIKGASPKNYLIKYYRYSDMRGFKNKPYEYGLKCPNCNALKLRKAGKAMAGNWQLKQRYECHHCGIFTVNPRRA
jgi:hypothetical protein